MKDPTPREEQFAERIRALERTVEQLSAARNLRSATIDEPGVLRVRRADGSDVAYVGRLSDGAMGVLFYRTDGTLAFSVDELNGQARVAFWNGGREVVGTDTVSGLGLARPYLPVQFGPSAIPANAPSTTSGTFTSLWRSFQDKQHPKLSVLYLVQADPDTTGEVQLWDAKASAQLDVEPVAAGDYRFVYTDTVAPAGDFGDLLDVELRARRTAGTGALRVHVVSAMGVQS